MSRSMGLDTQWGEPTHVRKGSPENDRSRVEGRPRGSEGVLWNQELIGGVVWVSDFVGFGQ